MSKQAAKEAAEALSDLNTFGVVVSIMEGGHLHTASHRFEIAIIRLCKRAMDVRLRDYDCAMAKVQP